MTVELNEKSQFRAQLVDKVEQLGHVCGRWVQVYDHILQRLMFLKWQMYFNKYIFYINLKFPYLEFEFVRKKLL